MSVLIDNLTRFEVQLCHAQSVLSAQPIGRYHHNSRPSTAPLKMSILNNAIFTYTSIAMRQSSSQLPAVQVVPVKQNTICRRKVNNIPPITVIQEISMLPRHDEYSHKLLLLPSRPHALDGAMVTSRPPLHASVALDHVLDFLLRNALVLGPGGVIVSKGCTLL